MRRARPEEAEQRAGLQLLTLAGFQCYTLSQGFRPQPGGTRQTVGLSDVFALHPAVGGIWWEAKAEGAPVREAQHRFLSNLEACKVVGLCGTADVVRLYLVSIKAASYMGPGRVFTLHLMWAVNRWPAGMPLRPPSPERKQVRRARTG